jgi:hypothetical protein
LGDATVRAQIAALVVGDPVDARRKRRLADREREGAGDEAGWQRAKGQD